MNNEYMNELVFVLVVSIWLQYWNQCIFLKSHLEKMSHLEQFICARYWVKGVVSNRFLIPSLALR